jgi:hypothetical protein
MHVTHQLLYFFPNQDTITATRENDFITNAWAAFASPGFHLSDAILMPVSEALTVWHTGVSL